MNIRCDWCTRPVKIAGRLMKVKFLTLCKSCRDKFRRQKG